MRAYVEVCELRIHTLSERVRPTQELICLLRMRRRDMATCIVRFGSGLRCKRLRADSLDADDLKFCSAAVPGEDRAVESCRICSAASSELRCSDGKQLK